ncbi:MAG: hypothetical protein FWG81_02970 [Betaproteobacteria bacterium]|nr:hypothetical protein [Betaproteobacteria bacterium]
MKQSSLLVTALLALALAACAPDAPVEEAAPTFTQDIAPAVEEAMPVEEEAMPAEEEEEVAPAEEADEAAPAEEAEPTEALEQ